MAGDPGRVRGPDGRPARLSPAAPPGRWSELAPPPPPPAQRSGLRGPGGRTPGAGRGRGGGCAAGVRAHPGGSGADATPPSAATPTVRASAPRQSLPPRARPRRAKVPPPKQRSCGGRGQDARPAPSRRPRPRGRPRPLGHRRRWVPRAEKPRPLNLRGRPTSPTGPANPVPQLQRGWGAPGRGVAGISCDGERPSAASRAALRRPSRPAAQRPLPSSNRDPRPQPALLPCGVLISGCRTLVFSLPSSEGRILSVKSTPAPPEAGTGQSTGWVPTCL